MHPTTREKAFWKRVDRRGPDECWLWIGTINPHPIFGGYGVMPMGERGKHMPAHRFAYEFLVGPIPDGLEIDHTCHNGSGCTARGPECLHKRCVNPRHLEPVTHAENIRRGNKTGLPPGEFCGNGHPLVLVGGKRRCMICQNERRRERRLDPAVLAAEAAYMRQLRARQKVGSRADD